MGGRILLLMITVLLLNLEPEMVIQVQGHIKSQLTLPKLILNLLIHPKVTSLVAVTVI
jgi:hypothetical protein